MNEFHLYEQGLLRTYKSHVNSIITFAQCLYVYMPFNYPWSLLVIVLLLLVPINFTGIRGNQTVLEGDSLNLTCEATGQPEPNMTWTKEKPGKQGNTVVVQEGKVLTITNIKRTDAGNYTCTAYNGFGKPKNRTVYVNVTCEYALKKCLNNLWTCELHACARASCRYDVKNGTRLLDWSIPVNFFSVLGFWVHLIVFGEQ